MIHSPIYYYLNYNLIFDLGNDTTICSNSFLEIGVQNIYMTYLWNNQAITNFITVNSPGTYVLQISDSAGCTSVDSINVNLNSLDFEKFKKILENDLYILEKHSQHSFA